MGRYEEVTKFGLQVTVTSERRSVCCTGGVGAGRSPAFRVLESPGLAYSPHHPYKRKTKIEK